MSLDRQEKPDAASSVMAFMDAVRADLHQALSQECSFMHIKVLGIVDGLGEPSMKQVADSLNITSPGATMVTEKLVENGELERMSDPDDRRVIRLKVTLKGKKTLKKGAEVIRGCISGRLSALTEAELGRLIRLLDKLS